MEIKRDRYLNRLVSYQWDGQVKVITGIRRCGKSYLLRVLSSASMVSADRTNPQSQRPCGFV
jgi:predicted AAA+ superfamily ATPase